LSGAKDCPRHQYAPCYPANVLSLHARDASLYPDILARFTRPPNASLLHAIVVVVLVKGGGQPTAFAWSGDRGVLRSSPPC